MEVEKSFSVEDVEARGALCVECMAAVASGGEVFDRVGAVLCRACAAEFYAACGGCGGLVARDEAMTRTGDEALFCFECFGKSAEGDAAPTDEEVAALVAEYVALHEELKRLDARAAEIKERLKMAARARPRVSNAVVLRAEGGAGVRCSYTVKTSYDTEKLAAAEVLLDAAEFAALFERKVTFAAVKGQLEEFLSSTDEARASARDAVRSAEQRTEVATLTVVVQKGRSAEGKRQEAKGKNQK